MSVASYQQRGTSNNSSVTFNNGSTNNNNNNSHNYNSADGNNGSATSSVRLAGDNTKDRMYEPKHHQKAVRVLTVIAYIFFVSLAAIMLSLYYVFLWHPPPPPQPSKMFTVISGGTVINITDCNHGIMMSQTDPTAALETPRVMPVINNNNINVNDRSEETDVISTTEMNSIQFNSIDDNLHNNNNDNISYQITMDDNNYKDKIFNFTIDSGGGSDGGDSENNYNNNENDNNYYI